MPNTTLSPQPLFESCRIRGIDFSPARFCAPLAGYTHSAFRRLLIELGGCGAIWTEMLAARQILKEDFETSPWLRRRSPHCLTVFQLMMTATDPTERIMQCLADNGVQAVDLNLACDAFHIRASASGSALFEDYTGLRTVLEQSRKYWPGLLTAKVRLGSRSAGWEQRLTERLRLIEDSGIDAVIMHPRFFEDKFKRRAQLELLPWIASLTRLPIIANGDILGPKQVQGYQKPLESAVAIMIGRMAVTQPWIFAQWNQNCDIDLGHIWQRHYEFIVEDFPPAVALRRVQMFTKYFAANFAFGHQFHVRIANSKTPQEACDNARDFLSRNPTLRSQPSMAGL